MHLAYARSLFVDGPAAAPSCGSRHEAARSGEEASRLVAWTPRRWRRAAVRRGATGRTGRMGRTARASHGRSRACARRAPCSSPSRYAICEPFLLICCSTFRFRSSRTLWHARGPPQLREPAAAAVGRAGRHRCVSAGAGCRRGSERADAAAGAGREPAAWVIFSLFFLIFQKQICMWDCIDWMYLVNYSLDDL